MQQHYVPTLHIAQISQALFERLRKDSTDFGCARSHMAYSPDLARLLSSNGAGQRQSSTGNYANEIAPPHSITSSARASTVAGIVSPIVRAVLRLMTSSNFVGCSTGRSAGLAPFKTLSTYV